MKIIKQNKKNENKNDFSQCYWRREATDTSNIVEVAKAHHLNVPEKSAKYVGGVC